MMRGKNRLVSKYLNNYKKNKDSKRKLLSLVLMLSLLVLIGVSWSLRITAISMTDDVTAEDLNDSLEINDNVQDIDVNAKNIENISSDIVNENSDLNGNVYDNSQSDSDINTDKNFVSNDNINSNEPATDDINENNANNVNEINDQIVPDDNEVNEECKLNDSELLLSYSDPVLANRYLKTINGKPGPGDTIYLDTSSTSWFKDSNYYARMYYNDNAEYIDCTTELTSGIWNFLLPDDFDSAKSIKFCRAKGTSEFNATSSLSLKVNKNKVIYASGGGSWAEGWYKADSNSYEGKNVFFEIASFGENGVTLTIGSNTYNLTEKTTDNNYFYYTFKAEDNVLNSTSMTLTYNGGETLTFTMNDLNGSYIVRLLSGVLDSPERYIYFDATYSQLKYVSADSGYYGNILPSYNGSTRRNMKCKASDGSTSTVYNMEAIEDSYSGTLVYKTTTTVDDKYDTFTFYGEGCESWTNSAKTIDSAQPDRYRDCFVAYTSDSCLYGNVLRSGYWKNHDNIKDAEKEKGTDIVDIPTGTKPDNENILWVKSKMYDYYSDYELNGKNKDTYDGGPLASSVANNHRRYATFRQFDQALSEYYIGSGGSVLYPIYTGHFQPSYWGNPFSAIASTLNLYGYDNTNEFIVDNNSDSDYDGNHDRYSYTTIGLVNDDLVNDYPISAGTSDLIEPHFNEDFILGNNSKKAVLGEVYENVSFPFLSKKAFADPVTGNVEPVNYWWFDSASSSLYLNKDANSENKYFLDGIGSTDINSKNVDSTGVVTSGVSNTYGYFPFNHNVADNNSSYYNYGFGNKISIDFRLTEDGMVIGEDNNKYDIKFRFSGDDDVWIFIDGKLVLDCGGAHGKVVGLIDFAKNKAYVSKVKKTAGSSVNYDSSLKATYKYIGAGVDGNTISTDNFYYERPGDVLERVGGKYDTSKRHTIEIFYMERGQWESNLSLAFNMAIEDELSISKDVDTTTYNVNPLFADYLKENSKFDFRIKNLTTHFGIYDPVTNIIYDDIAFADEFTTPLVFGSKVNTSEVYKETTNGVLSSYNGYGGADPVTRYKVVKYIGKDTAPTTTAERENRLIKISKDDGTTVDITHMEMLDFYVSIESNSASINKMFVELIDNSGRRAYGLLTGITDGTLTKWRWSELSVNLSGLTYDTGFDKTNVKYIGVSYDDNVYVFFDTFIFKPGNEVPVMNGFSRSQKAIADYGSATSGVLENATGATYKSSLDSTKTYAVGNDGKITVKNGEEATFYSQFRIGSYLSVVECLDASQKELYEPDIKVYEDDEEVGTYYSYASTDTVTSLSSSYMPITGNININSYDEDSSTFVGIDDERIERYLEKVANEENGLENNKYSEGKSDGDTGTRPVTTEPMFVYRSFENPDNEINAIRLKFAYANVARTGSISITKAEYVTGELSGDYTFNIAFSNVGGANLEGSTPVPVQSVTLHKGETWSMNGIPVGTEYKITEVASDSSTIMTVTENGNPKDFDIESQSFTGVIGKDLTTTTHGETKDYIVTNALIPVTKIKVTKVWDDSDNTALRPESGIFIKLYRSTDKDADISLWQEAGDYINLLPGNSYSAVVENLPVYDDYRSALKKKYYYRMLEYKKVGDSYVLLTGTDVITDYDEPVYTEITTSPDGTDDGIIIAVQTPDNSGSSGELKVTNKYNPPSYVLPQTGGGGNEYMRRIGILILILGVFRICHRLKGDDQATFSNEERKCWNMSSSERR